MKRASRTWARAIAILATAAWILPIQPSRSQANADEFVDRIAEWNKAKRKAKANQKDAELVKAIPELASTSRDFRDGLLGEEALQRSTRESVAKFNQYKQEVGPLREILVGGLDLSLKGGITNHDGDQYRASASIPTDLDRTVTDFGFTLGWSGRRFIRDYLLWNSKEQLEGYSRWKASKSPRNKENVFYWAWMDAVKLEVTAGWGSALDDPQGKNNSLTTSKGQYRALLKYELPIDGWVENPNPFR